MTTPQTPGPGIAVEERIDTRPDRVLRPEPGDSERFSHYVPKGKLMEALVNGTPCDQYSRRRVNSAGALDTSPVHRHARSA